MKYRYTIKTALAKLLEAKKKRKLKVVLNYKKELLPVLLLLKKGSLFYKFLIKSNKIHVFLKKEKNMQHSKNNHRQKKISSLEITRFIVNNPDSVLVVSTARGVLSPNLYKKSNVAFGGKLLCFFN
jgi:ribosomal protein S8